MACIRCCLVTGSRDSLVCARTRSYSYAFPCCGTVSHPYFPSAHRGQRRYHVKSLGKSDVIYCFIVCDQLFTLLCLEAREVRRVFARSTFRICVLTFHCCDIFQIVGAVTTYLVILIQFQLTFSHPNRHATNESSSTPPPHSTMSTAAP
jgi:hypothetical protein